MTDPIEEALSADECAKIRTVALNDARPATLINPVLRDYVAKLATECDRLRAEVAVWSKRAQAAESALAKVMAKRDEAAAESMRRQSKWFTQLEAAESALAKVTAERDDADRRAGAAERRAEEARAALDQACGDEVERAKDAVVLDAWDALRSLAAVDADAQEAQIGPAVDRLIARVRTAEAALAAAREAMPTKEECDALGSCVYGNAPARESFDVAGAWLSRLDAYRAAQPAASAAAAPDLPELCAVCSCTRRLGDYCPTPDPACVVHGTGRADGGEVENG